MPSQSAAAIAAPKPGTLRAVPNPPPLPLLPTWTVSRLLMWFFAVNVGLALLFWGLRIPIMTGDHFGIAPTSTDQGGAPRRLRPVLDALNASIMTQTTVGSLDVMPISVTATWLTTLQAASSLLSIPLVLGVLLLHGAAVPQQHHVVVTHARRTPAV